RQSGPRPEPSACTGREAHAADVLVLDTIGELRRVYTLARIAFVGGTLVPVGGHDMLQPLAKRVPVLFGPYTHNCREIAATVLEAGAGRRIASSSELAREWIRLLNAPEEARSAGQKGFDLLLQNQGASNRYAGMIAALVGR
ncbi:MAG: 3-deoxy-D-manno-octulosonic acid transferase, partial [Chloroflexi bacterium]|nr:3-deoxy-D-manno-octulosonic acid transferase [Chloroflexota bacterium]